MVDLSSLPIIRQIISMFSYLHKYFDLNAKEKRLKNWEQEHTLLRNIYEENSKNYQKMIEFNLHNVPNAYIHAQDIEISPHLDFEFSISNHSIFDFMTKKINILIIYEGSELGRVEIPKEINLLHQETQYCQAKLDKLHVNFINQLKSLKKEGKIKKLTFKISEIEIFFIGYKEFRKTWGEYGFRQVFELEIPMEKVSVTL